MPATPLCATCGATPSATAKYCQRCGASVTGEIAPPRASPGSARSTLLPLSIAGIVVLSLLAFFAGRNWRRMDHVARGQADSARFFSPMAIQSMARAQSDTILAARPTHLLGLILRMRVAGLQLDTLARRGLEERFRAALPSERTRELADYADHRPDIESAARDASAQPIRR